MDVLWRHAVKKCEQVTLKGFYFNSNWLIDLAISALFYARSVHTLTNEVAADAQNYLPRGVDSRDIYIVFSGLCELSTSWVLLSSSRANPVDNSLLMWPCLL